MFDGTISNITLATHRVTASDEAPFFPHELLIAAISIGFCRYTVRSHVDESWYLRLVVAMLLGVLAFMGTSYDLIIAAEIFSYVASWLLVHHQADIAALLPPSMKNPWLRKALSLCAGAAFSMALGHSLCNTSIVWKLVGFITPRILIRGLEYLFPIRELMQAWDIMMDLTLEPTILRQMVQHLFFVTFHMQIGIGYLGIHFLHKQQERKNQLIRLDVPSSSQESVKEGKEDEQKSQLMAERSRLFKRGAAPFIFGVALPYMIQIIAMGNINRYAFVCLADDMHSMVRFRQVFERSNNLVALANNSTTTPEAYAESITKVITTSYDLFNRKLFSLPKILLLPQIFARQPFLLIQAFPFIFFSDWIKASAMSYLTTVIEALTQELKDLKSVRTKVESFDIKNADLLQRSGGGASAFTRKKWQELTVKVQTRNILSDLLTRSKMFFSFIQHHFVFVILIDCALADMIALGKMGPSDIFVYSRAIEDAIDLILMRSRNEAELARMQTEIERLDIFREVVIDTQTDPRLLPCTVDNTHHALVLGNVQYTRGPSHASASNLTLKPGVYALTGANGSGKSTLFRVLMSCSTNSNPVDLPASILLSSTDDLTCPNSSEQDSECKAPDPDVPPFSITMPSAEVIEISQNFYWPLHAKPIEWILRNEGGIKSTSTDRSIRRVAEALHALEFFQTNTKENEQSMGDSVDTTQDESIIARIMEDLQMEKDDWFGELSGGQRSKVELVRLVFLEDTCPDLLLIDETFAPLDPSSKQVVMGKLKSFCEMSIIIVIYHADIDTDGTTTDCIASANFFDKNIHLNAGKILIRDTCEINMAPV